MQPNIFGTPGRGITDPSYRRFKAICHKLHCRLPSKEPLVIHRTLSGKPGYQHTKDYNLTSKPFHLWLEINQEKEFWYWHWQSNKRAVWEWWCTVWWCIVWWCTVWWCIVWWCIVWWCIVRWCIVWWCIVWWCIVRWCIVWWCIVRWCTVWWCIVWSPKTKGY